MPWGSTRHPSWSAERRSLKYFLSSPRSAAVPDRGRRWEGTHHQRLEMPASLLYEATKALTQEELSALGSNGLLELCALDRRFHPCAGRPPCARHEACPTTRYPVPRVQV